jgi:hypothetical protein
MQKLNRKYPITRLAPVVNEHDNSHVESLEHESNASTLPLSRYQDEQSYLTADNRTIALMNDVKSNCNNLACNLANSLTETDKQMISKYKNKYYKMYAHQLNCNNDTDKLTGCGQKCMNGQELETCNTDDCKKRMAELNSGPDFMSLNRLLFKKNNERPCSKCVNDNLVSRSDGVQSILNDVTKGDNVSRQFMDSNLLNRNVVGYDDNMEHFNNMPEPVKSVKSVKSTQQISPELIKKDKELAKKKKVSFANVNNFSNFNNYISQSGNLESSVDKLAEIRTNTTSNSTCELNKYGQNIADIYDNLMNNQYAEYKKACDTAKISGVNAFDGHYAQV